MMEYIWLWLPICLGCWALACIFANEAPVFNRRDHSRNLLFAILFGWCFPVYIAYGIWRGFQVIGPAFVELVEEAELPLLTPPSKRPNAGALSVADKE